MEVLTDPRLLPGSQVFIEKTKTLPGPFQQICLIRSRSRKITNVVLGDFGLNEPYLTVVKQPESILFKPLNGGPLAVLNILPHGPYEHLVSRMLYTRIVSSQ